MDFLDYYAILGIPRFHASPRQIRVAYFRRIIKLFWRNIPPEETCAIVQQYNTAYMILGNERDKLVYDAMLALRVGVEPNRNRTPKGKKLSLAGFAVFALYGFLIIFAVLTATKPIDSQSISAQGSNSIQNQAATVKQVAQSQTLIPETRPWNGTMFQSIWSSTKSSIRVETLDGPDYLIKLESCTVEDAALVFYVHGGKHSTIPVAPGTYVLKYAYGDTWYGLENRFGPDTNYQQATDLFTFTEAEGWTVELYPQINGNLPTEDIPENEF